MNLSFSSLKSGVALLTAANLANSVFGAELQVPSNRVSSTNSNSVVAYKRGERLKPIDERTILHSEQNLGNLVGGTALPSEEVVYTFKSIPGQMALFHFTPVSPDERRILVWDAKKSAAAAALVPATSRKTIQVKYK